MAIKSVSAWTEEKYRNEIVKMVNHVKDVRYSITFPHTGGNGSDISFKKRVCVHLNWRYRFKSHLLQTSKHVQGMRFKINDSH